MGIKTVAIYSEADRGALHVQAADEAVCIGPPPALESYLNIGKIIDVAKQSDCDGIHPGYGFLSENDDFSRACEEAKIIFVGPNAKALGLVGDKLESRKAMGKAGIPLIPGMDKPLKSIPELQKRADEIGYPVMVKASAGGGGKGMRIVYKPADLKHAIEAGQREAKSAFGDETVYLEKHIEKPRHIEFQVLADNYGNNVHLFERECSLQRRHQKIIEETPSVALDDELRQKMGETARRVMQLAGYNNAGTVEFLLDQNRNFYFLEVNARIQVEHPITELVTGVDLVKHQIRIASGEKLTLKQEELRQRGHAIECRIYAEDPENNFFPSFGNLLFVKEPAGPGIRCDSGIYTGLEIPHYYDPILSKLIVWDENRESAIQRMDSALSDYVIMGVKTQVTFLRDLVRHPEFGAGNLNTNFIADHFSEWSPKRQENNIISALLGAAISKMQKPAIRSAEKEQTALTPWQLVGRWEILSGLSK